MPRPCKEIAVVVSRFCLYQLTYPSPRSASSCAERTAGGNLLTAPCAMRFNAALVSEKTLSEYSARLIWVCMKNSAHTAHAIHVHHHA